MGSTGRLAALLVALALLAGCGGQSGQPPASPPASEEPTGQGQVSTPDAVMEPLRSDAAARAGVDPSQVEVVSSERVTWSDGSLGCPQPGVAYTQALVDGYHVVLEADGTSYDYRMPDQGEFVLCEQAGS